jgi:hypothetical protein
MLLDTERAHQAATQQNQTDWAHKPSQLATNQHLIDVHFNKRKREIADMRDGLESLLADWITVPTPDGKLRTDRPPLPIWTMLSYDQQRAVDGFLARNAWASHEEGDRWIAAEHSWRAAEANPAVVRPGEDLSALYTLAQDVRNNRKRHEDAVRDYLSRTDKLAKFDTELRVYVEGMPGYMVADVIVTGGGNTHINVTEIHIVEVKTGNAILSEHQQRVLAEAVKEGRVYIVNQEAATKLGIKPNVTLKAQHVIPYVWIIGGDQEAIKRQLSRQGIGYVPRGGGRLGPRAGGGPAP